MRVAMGVWSCVAVVVAVALAGCGSGPSGAAPRGSDAAPAVGGGPAKGVLPPGSAPISAAGVERALVRALTPPAPSPGALPARGRAPLGALTAASCRPVSPRVFACSLTFGSTPTRFTVRVQRNGDIAARRHGGGSGPGAFGVWSTAGR
jgi:hypothetical protein